MKKTEYQDAKEDYLLNLKEDDWNFYWNATDKEIEEDFLYHCSMYDDTKHITKKGKKDEEIHNKRFFIIYKCV